ncbi:MAG: ABC transporter substrate-binding protein [Lachnospiraceae bacterium]|nr:ABC transporter substrate-binding protein [Lachnospiraceae bacterium]
MKRKEIIRRAAALTLSAALLTVGAAGCGNADTSSTAAQGTETAAGDETQLDAAADADTADAGEAESNATDEAAFDAEENTIRFALEAGTIRTAVVILAKQLGYYEEEGVNVEIVDNNDNTATLTAISSGKKDVDVLGTGIVPDLTFIANGSDLVIFEGTAAEGGAIISRPEDTEKFKDLKNYEGATAALVRNESGWIVTRQALLDAGYDVDSIQLLEVDSRANVAQAVAKGEADIGFFPEEFVGQFADLNIEEVMPVAELQPLYVCCRQVTSSDKLAQKHDAFVKYTKANLRAFKYFSDEANRQEIDKLLADFSGQTEEYVDNYFFVNSTTLTLDPNKSGIETYYKALENTGYFEDGTDVDVADHIDTEVYKAALDQIVSEYPYDEFYQQQLTIFEQYN